MNISAKTMAVGLCFALGSLTQVSAQIISYKRNALELKVGVGGTLFFGDLGGSKGGRKDGFFDYDVESMRGNTSFGLKFNFTNFFAKVMFNDSMPPILSNLFELISNLDGQLIKIFI